MQNALSLFLLVHRLRADSPERNIQHKDHAHTKYSKIRYKR